MYRIVIEVLNILMCIGQLEFNLTLFKIRHSKILCVLVSAVMIASYSLLLSVSGILVAVAYSAIGIFAYVFLFKVSPLDALIMQLFTTNFSYTLDCFFIIVFELAKLGNYDIDVINNPAQYIALKIIGVFIWGLLCLFAKKSRINLKQVLENNGMYTYVLFQLGLLLLFVSPTIYLVFYKAVAVSTTYKIYSGILVFATVSYSIINMSRQYNNNLKSQQLISHELYANSLEKTNETLRNFKHDFGNILHTMNGYIKLGKYHSLEKYLGEINADFGQVKTSDILVTSLRQIPTLYGMLLSKLNLAELKGIAFEVTVLVAEIDFHDINPLDISRALGILMDNALEAAEATEAKWVSLVLEKKYDQIQITISNSCSKDIEMDHLFDSGYTQKSGHSGVGLSVVAQIIKKYRQQDYNISLKTEMGNQVFTQTLTI